MVKNPHSKLTGVYPVYIMANIKFFILTARRHTFVTSVIDNPIVEEQQNLWLTDKTDSKNETVFPIKVGVCVLCSKLCLSGCRLSLSGDFWTWLGREILTWFRTNWTRSHFEFAEKRAGSTVMLRARSM